MTLLQALMRCHPRHWPLPGACWVCLAWSRERVCAACRARFAPAVLRCTGCALPLPSSGQSADLCAACLKHPLGLQACHCAVDFSPPWDELLHALKYRSALGVVDALAELWPPMATPPQVWLPVPLHPSRLRSRGHNQSLLIAQALSRRWPAPVWSNALLRLRDTPSQTQLSREQRRRNLRHAFALSPATTVRGLHLGLVDDVLTTGATLAELSELLQRHGAASVQAWVLARTPAPQT
jgi:ComF family protein